MSCSSVPAISLNASISDAEQSNDLNVANADNDLSGQFDSIAIIEDFAVERMDIFLTDSFVIVTDQLRIGNQLDQLPWFLNDLADFERKCIDCFRYQFILQLRNKVFKSGSNIMNFDNKIVLLHILNDWNPDWLNSGTDMKLKDKLAPKLSFNTQYTPD